MPAPVRTGPAGLQFAPNVEVIIDLPVEGNGETPALAPHRLRAGFREIEDRQTAVTESYAGSRVGPDAAGIGAPVPEGVCHPRRIAGDRAFIAATRTQQTSNSAHQLVSPERSR